MKYTLQGQRTLKVLIVEIMGNKQTRNLYDCRGGELPPRLLLQLQHEPTRCESPESAAVQAADLEA